LSRSGQRRSPPAALAAYVLHRYDWSESSLILDLFTRERGRLAVAAKGAKRPYSQLRGALLPFQRLNVSLARSVDEHSAEVQVLRGVEWAGGAPMPGGAALFAGFYLNELLLKLLARQDPHPALFDAYAQALPVIATAGEGAAQPALRAFELTLLRETGVLPDLGRVTPTLQPVQPQQRYVLRPDSGVNLGAGDELAIDGRQLLALQAALDAADGDALRAACGAARSPLRATLRALLHYHLDSPTLRTRQVMADVQRLMDRTSHR